MRLLKDEHETHVGGDALVTLAVVPDQPSVERIAVTMTMQMPVEMMR
jgi:hypothetical protein